MVIIYLLILFCFCQWSGISPCLSMSISSNVIRVLPAFTPYTSGVPDKVCDFVGCSYTLHSKNHPNWRFYLHNSKKNCTFAPNNQNLLLLCQRYKRLRPWWILVVLSVATLIHNTINTFYPVTLASSHLRMVISFGVKIGI